MNAITPAKAADIMEAVIAKGDIASLTPDQRAKYYVRVCESIGLNPMTRPFEYITLNNKLTLYARKDCTDQLRSLHNISVTELTESERDGVFIVTAKVSNGTRSDAAKGAVHIQGLKGEALANAMMKAETKAKRRATLSICGLGFLDETEVEDIPMARNGNGRARDDGPPAPPTKMINKPEVIWDDNGERPATMDDFDAPTTDAGVRFDSAAWRKDAEGALSGCEEVADVFHAHKNVIKPAFGKASESDWKAIQKIYTETLDRVSKE